ncbi:MAG: gmk [Gammaproteobacteria bacterium]|jgi:guanylate kinase|nr:gmk [Gammaproteobacteria bacterium]
MSKQGTLYAVAAPSGTGKTTLVKALIESLPNITVSISHTTRPQRPAETHGINYYFIDENTFQTMVKHHDFLEYALVFNHHYGTSRSWVEKTLAQGVDVILEIDWQGCLQIQRLFPDCISIFILPPSLTDLAKRLKNRAQDSAEVIQQRLFDAREAVSHIHHFNYVVMNVDFDTALNDLKIIVQANRLLQKKQPIALNKLLAEFTVSS